MRYWKLIGVFALLWGPMGEGSCADLYVLSFSYTAESLCYPIVTHKKKHAYHKKSHQHKHKRSKSKNHHNSVSKTEKILENYTVEGKCNRLACSSNIKIAESCLKTKKLWNKHKKCFRAFCRYGCNDTDYDANQEVFDLCNSICSSRKYQNGHKGRIKR